MTEEEEGKTLDIPGVPEEGYRPQLRPGHNDRMRAMVTGALLAILIGSVIVTAYLVIRVVPDGVAKAKDFSALVFTPMLSIFSAVIGFYFGQKK